MATEKDETVVNRDLEAATAHAPSAPVDDSLGNAEASVSAKDEAIAMVGEQEHAVDPAVVARAVRKIDWFLIPSMIVGCKSTFSILNPQIK